ncbi:MAG: hypothetical protein HKM95_07255 [Inquilinus sp.]|nr:hypothetical protein [Inquilinus sp.]
MTRLVALGIFAALALAAVSIGASPLAQAADNRVAIHVDENDPAKMTLALNNAANVIKYYESIGETVEVRIVAYGPGLHMLREDTSPVRDRIGAMSLELPDLSFAACGNTHSAMSRNEGREIGLLSEAEMVASGVVELIELQQQGWAYVRP